MKKASVIISVAFSVIFISLLIVFGSKIVFIGTSSVLPFFLLILNLYLGVIDIRFEQSGKEYLNSGDIDLTYEERCVFYLSRGLLFLPGAIPQFFLLFCFGHYLKIILSTALFFFLYATATFAGAAPVRKIMRERIKNEEKELAEQIKHEQTGYRK